MGILYDLYFNRTNIEDYSKVKKESEPISVEKHLLSKQKERKTPEDKKK